MSGSSGYAGRGPTGSQSGGLSRGVGPGMKAPTGYKSFQQYSPEQMQLFQQMFSNVGPDSYLSRLAGGDEGMFNEIEAPALRQFSGQIGQLASRFSGGGEGRGAMSSRNSSGFQNSSSAAASDFASQLQSNRMNLQRQAIMDLMGLSGDLLEKQPYGLYQKPQKEKRNYGGLIGAGLGGAIGAFGGPVGAVAGAQMGHQIGQAFT